MSFFKSGSLYRIKKHSVTVIQLNSDSTFILILTGRVWEDFVLCYLFGCGEVGAVGARGAVFGGGAAGNVVGVRQGPALHLSQHTLLEQQGLEEACVAVEFHQVIDLKGGKRRERNNDMLTTKGKTRKRRGRVEKQAKGLKKDKSRNGDRKLNNRIMFDKLQRNRGTG